MKILTNPRAPCMIIRRSLDPTGRYVGIYHKNSIFNTLVYDVNFPDEEVK